MFAFKPYKQQHDAATNRARSSVPSHLIAAAAAGETRDPNNKKKHAAVAATRRIPAVPVSQQLAAAFKVRRMGFAPERLSNKVAAWENGPRSSSSPTATARDGTNGVRLDNAAPGAVAILCLTGSEQPVGYEAPLAAENGNAQVVVGADNATVSLERYLVAETVLTGKKSVSLASRSTFEFDAVVPLRDLLGDADGELAGPSENLENRNDAINALCDQLCSNYLTRDLLPPRGSMDGNHLPTGHSVLLLQPAYNQDHKDIFSSPENPILRSLCRGMLSHLLRGDVPYFGGVGLSAFEVPATQGCPPHSSVRDLLSGSNLPMTATRKVAKMGSTQASVYGPSKPAVKEFTDFDQIQELCSAMVSAHDNEIPETSHRVFLLQLLQKKKINNYKNNNKAIAAEESGEPDENTNLSHATSTVSIAIVQLADFSAAAIHQKVANNNNNESDDDHDGLLAMNQKIFQHLARDRKEILNYLCFAGSLSGQQVMNREVGILAPTLFQSNIANILNFYCWHRPDRCRTALVSVIPSKIDGNSLFEIAGVSAALHFADNVKRHEIPKRTIAAIDMRDVAIKRWAARASRFRDPEAPRKPWQQQFAEDLKTAHENSTIRNLDGGASMMAAEEGRIAEKMSSSVNSSVLRKQQKQEQQQPPKAAEVKEEIPAETSLKEEKQDDGKYSDNDEFESSKHSEQDEQSNTPAKNNDTKKPNQKPSSSNLKSKQQAEALRPPPHKDLGPSPLNNNTNFNHKPTPKPPAAKRTAASRPQPQKPAAAPLAKQQQQPKKPVPPVISYKKLPVFAGNKKKTAQIGVSPKKNEDAEVASEASTPISDVSDVDASLLSPQKERPLPPQLSEIEHSGREEQDERLKREKASAPFHKTCERVAMKVLKSKKSDLQTVHKSDVSNDTINTNENEEHETTTDDNNNSKNNNNKSSSSVKRSGRNSEPIQRGSFAESSHKINHTRQDSVLSVKSRNENANEENNNNYNVAIIQPDDEDLVDEKKEAEVDESSKVEEQTQEVQEYSRGSSAARSDERRKKEFENEVNNSSHPSTSQSQRMKDVEDEQPEQKQEQKAEQDSSRSSRRSSTVDSRIQPPQQNQQQQASARKQSARSSSRSSASSYDSRIKVDSRKNSVKIAAHRASSVASSNASSNITPKHSRHASPTAENVVAASILVNNKQQERQPPSRSGASSSASQKEDIAFPQNHNENEKRIGTQQSENNNDNNNNYGDDFEDDQGEIVGNEEKEEVKENVQKINQTETNDLDTLKRASSNNISSSNSDSNTTIPHSTEANTCQNDRQQTHPVSTVENGPVGIVSLPTIHNNIEDEIKKRQQKSVRGGAGFDTYRIGDDEDGDADESKPVIGGDALNDEMLDSPSMNDL